MERSELENKFKPGELFIYQNGDRYEIGKVKGVKDETHYWCYYHEGSTAASTPVDVMHKITNDFCIKETTLGGDAERM